MNLIISSPYSKNILFKTKETILIDEDIINDFNNLYSKVRYEKQNYPGINNSLNLIFDSLYDQTEDNLMQLFIEELRYQCNKILENDLKIQELNHKHQTNQLNDFNKIAYDGLTKNNFFIIRINDRTINKILNISRNDLEIFEEKRKLNQNTREDLSLNSGYVPRTICRLLNKEFKKTGILNAVSKYMGFPVKVGGCALELSVNEATWHNVKYYEGSNSKTKYFHHDESIIDPKAIVYLSDVSEKNGPVSYLDESKIKLDINGIQNIVGKAILEVGRDPKRRLFNHYNLKGRRPFESKKLRNHFSRLPDIMKHNSHFGWDVEIGSEDEKNILNNEIKVLGPKGTCLLFDGSRLLHRGGIVENNSRVSLQVIFKNSADLKLHKRVLSKIKSLLNLS